jgi:site-specific recombinase XerD
MSSPTTARRLELAGPSLPPLTYYIQDFLNAKMYACRPKTLAAYELPLRQYQAHVGPHFWPPTYSSINSYLAGVKGKQRSPNTIHAYYRVIRTWCNWLVEHGIIDKNPIDLVQVPPRTVLVPRAPRLIVLKKLLNAAANNDRWQGKRDACIFHTLLDTGMRVGELVRLQVDDVDFEQMEIRVQAGKTHEERAVVFSDSLHPVLWAWLEQWNRLHLPVELAALFVSRWRGQEWRALTESGVSQALRRIEQRAGIAHLRVHDLRHAYAIYALRNRADLEDIKNQLGHKSLATTSRYLKADNFERAQRHNATSPLNLL